MNYANMHLHSTFSDAGFTPEQLVLIGKALGYRALVLTDHETDGGCKRFQSACEREGIRTVSGAEFYGDIEGKRPHFTALDFDRNDPGIRNFIRERCRLQREWTRRCVERGLSLGYWEGLSWDDVLAFSDESAWICADSVRYTLGVKGILDEQVWDIAYQNTFKAEDLLAVKPVHPSAQEVIRVVRKAGGVIAWAHPTGTYFLKYIGQMVEWGLNGVEISHPQLNGDLQVRAMEAAKAYGLYLCGGTDHTGPMSCNGGKLAVPAFHGISEEDFDTLVHRRLG